MNLDRFVFFTVVGLMTMLSMNETTGFTATKRCYHNRVLPGQNQSIVCDTMLRHCINIRSTGVRTDTRWIKITQFSNRQANSRNFTYDFWEVLQNGEGTPSDVQQDLLQFLSTNYYPSQFEMVQWGFVPERFLFHTLW